MTLRAPSEMTAEGRYFASNIIILYNYNYIDSTPWKAIIGMALRAIKITTYTTVRGR